MREWKYLESEPFRARYAIALYYLQRRAVRVLEVGGYKTPLDEYAWGSSISEIVVIDPLIEPKELYLPRCSSQLKDCHVLHIHAYIEDFEPRGIYDGFLCLGLDLKQEALKACIRFMKQARLSVIEIPSCFPPSMDNLKTILSQGFDVEVKIMLDLSNNNFGDLSNSYPVRPMRELYVLHPK